MATIRTGLQKGLDVTEYANPAFDSEQMYLIMYGMCSDVDYKVYSKLDENGKAVFNDKQMNQIYLGLMFKVDVSSFAKPEYDEEQMKQIRIGLITKRDISIYAKPEFTGEQMRLIRFGLGRGLDVSSYAKPELTPNEMEDIFKQLKEKIS